MGEPYSSRAMIVSLPLTRRRTVDLMRVPHGVCRR